jgi:plastocyanin
MKPYAVLLALAAAMALPGSRTESAAAVQPGPATHTVVIDSVQYSPLVLTVRVGDTVVWVNRDPFPHTATAADGRFDSQSIDSGRSWKFTPKKPGVIAYGCKFHPTMKATLRVQ